MTIEDIKRCAKEYGSSSARLIEDSCPSAYGYSEYSSETKYDCAENDLCLECWIMAEKLDDVDKSVETAESSEQVNHPSHYQQEGRRECIEEMRIMFGDEAVREWCILTAYKYLYRAGHKADNSAEQDFKKSQWYIDYAADMEDK